MLARIELLNPTLNAFASCMPTRRASWPARPRLLSRAATRSARFMASRSRSRTTSRSRGSRHLRLAPLTENVARETSPIGARIVAAGGIVVGRTNAPEYAWRGSTDNRLFGETRNPWDLTRLPGFQWRRRRGRRVGPDSARARYRWGRLDPHSGLFCGIVGHKPSFGRVPFFPSPGAVSSPRTPAR